MFTKEIRHKYGILAEHCVINLFYVETVTLPGVQQLIPYCNINIAALWYIDGYTRV